MLSENDKKSLTQQEYVDSVNCLKASTTINDLMVSATTILGMTQSLYIHFPAIGAVDFNNSGIFHLYNLQDQVSNFYDRNNRYIDDPVLVSVLAKGSPIWLSDAPRDPYIRKRGHMEMTQKTIKLLGDGLCCPLYGPDNRKGYAFVSFGRGKSEFDPIMPFQIHAYLQAMHVQYCLMLKRLHKKIDLTARESEVLEFMSYGKTNPEIARILEISPRTVDVHASKIFAKMGTRDRVSTALRAQTISIDV